MYVFEEMIDLGDQEWRTPAHRQVAINALIGNASIRSRDQLIEFCGLINGIDTDKIRKVSGSDLVSLGISLR